MKKVRYKSNRTFKLEKVVSVKEKGRGEKKVIAEMVGLPCKIQQSGGNLSDLGRSGTLRRGGNMGNGGILSL